MSVDDRYCLECGDRERERRSLNAHGVCENRHGCEHRQYQHRARIERLLGEMDRPAWHRSARGTYPTWPGPWCTPDAGGYGVPWGTLGSGGYGPKRNAWDDHPSNRRRSDDGEE